MPKAKRVYEARQDNEGIIPKLFDRLNDKKEKEIRVLANFISIFCRDNLPRENTSLH